MPIEPEQQAILENNEFFFDFKKMIYINADSKKVFSFEAIQDHDLSWLRERISEPNETQSWIFYFNEQPSERLRRDLIDYLEG